MKAYKRKAEGWRQQRVLNEEVTLGKEFSVEEANYVRSMKTQLTIYWIRADEAEIIFLKDFCCNPAIIAWGDFLQAI